MPKLNCKCGTITNLSNIPCEHDWLIISDTEYLSYSGSIDAEELYLKMKLLTKCLGCGRLYIYWNGSEEPPVVYQIESE